MRLEDLKGKYVYRRYPITINEEECGEREIHDFMNPLEFIKVLEVYPNGAGAMVQVGRNIYDQHSPLYMSLSTIIPVVVPNMVKFVPSIYLDFAWEDATDIIAQIQSDYVAINNKAELYYNSNTGWYHRPATQYDKKILNSSDSTSSIIEKLPPSGKLPTYYEVKNFNDTVQIPYPNPNK